jgi:hypothetical protein
MSEQLLIDPLVPAGRLKFGTHELCRILGADGEPVSIRTIRAALESGQLGGHRLPFAAAPGAEARIKIEWVTADDLRLYLLRTRTMEPAEHERRALALFDTWGPAALDRALRHLTTLRASASRRG